LNLVGLSLHLGSQMQEFSGFKDALQMTKKFFLEIKKEFLTVQKFDVGGAEYDPR
jgi:diaminopimelate decarboxylase